MTDDHTPKIIGFGGPGFAGATVLGATWEDDAPQVETDGDTRHETTGAPQRQEEST